MTTRKHTFTLTALFTAALSAGAAQAQAPAEPAAAPAPAAEPAVASTEPAADPAPGAEPARSETPWIKRHRPVRNSWELGIYGGVFLPSPSHEFYAPQEGAANMGHQPLGKVGPDIGLRVGYYPLSFLGLELEAGVMPMKAADASKATLYTFRPVIVFQLPYRIAPFIRGGFGGVGISSPTLGKDLDPSFNIGGGVKFYLTRRVLLRLDIVDNVATAVGVGKDRSNNLEVLLGLSLRLGKKKDEQPPPPKLVDSDGDGLYDPGQVGVPPDQEDACPAEPGPRENRGCPLKDSDGDGLYDPGQAGVPPDQEDACPAEPGPRENRGCPLKDSDKDGLYDPGQPGVAAADVDACPAEPGPRELQGCPDRDKDRIIDKNDKCPDEPETVNQVDDADGCPDKVPDAVKKISGVLEGIYFDVDKDTIKPRSLPILEKALRVLAEHPGTRWNIRGHTDSDGAREHNVDLSRRRAESVKRYLVEHGINEGRLVAEGFGPDEPIDTNATAKGKARNRRIEFALVD